MDGYSKSRPLYFFVLRTGPKPPFDVRDKDNDKLLRQLIADNSSRIFRTDLKKCDKGKTEAVAALSGSNSAFGYWNNPKVAANVSRDLHILAINEEIKPGTFKWLDIHGHGMFMVNGGLDPVTGYCYEPIAFNDRVFETRIPDPGREIAVISQKWGDYGSDIIYINLGGTQEGPRAEASSADTTQQQQSPAHNNKKRVNGSLQEPKDTVIAQEDTISAEKVKTTHNKPQRNPVKLHAHRPQLELEPEDGIEETHQDFDPNYGKAEPYSFGKRLSLSMPWKKKEKPRETGSGPASCGSSISSAESERSWTKTGSLPTVFRKRNKKDKTPGGVIKNHEANKEEKAPLCEEEKVALPKMGKMRRFRASLSDLFRPKSKRQDTAQSKRS